MLQQIAPVEGLQEIQVLHETGMLGRRSRREHENAHLFYQTPCDGGQACTDAAHRAADRMITPAAFLEASKETVYLDAIAARLWVTRADVEAYLDGLPITEWRHMRNVIGRELI